MREKLEALLSETFEYTKTNVNPRTATGKERKSVVQAFMQFCTNEKKYTDSHANTRFFENQSLDELRKGISMLQVSNLQAFMDQLSCSGDRIVYTDDESAAQVKLV